MNTSTFDPYSVPFVGRTPQVEHMRQILNAAQSGRVQTMFVQGEAGIGKTRLASVAVSEAVNSGWLALRGRAQTVGTGLAFAPVIEAFRSAVLRMEDTEKTQVGESFPYLNAFFPDLGGSLPVPLLDPQLERTRVFETLRMFTLHLSSQQPLILWIDDLPEADPDTLEWLHYCVQHTEHARIVFLATCRTSFEPPLEAYRQLETYFLRHRLMHAIELEPLLLPECKELVRSRLDGEVQEAALNVLSAKTQGVPLYLLEVVHSLVQSGGLHLEDGSWALQAGVHDRVPPTITSLLNQRLENLAPLEEQLLPLLAVSDGPVPWTLLQKAAGCDSAELTEAVIRLLQKGIVSEEKSGRELQYGFRHPLLKAVAHARVPETLSRQAHVKLARAWFDHDVAKAAFHILASGSASEMETSVRMLYEAGLRYLSLRSYRAAAEYLEQAAQLVDQSAGVDANPLRSDIRLALSEALTYVDRAPQALLLLDELYHETFEPALKIRLKRFMAWVESTRSYEACVRHIEEGLTWWDGQQENSDVLWMLNERIFNDLNTGNLSDAQASLHALQQYACQHPSTRTSLLCMCRETHVSLLSLNKHTPSAADADFMLAEARKLGEPELIYDAYCLLGYKALNLGDARTALRYATECAALVRRNGMVVHEVSVRLVGMCALFLGGDYEKSKKEAEDVEQLAREYEIHGAVVCTLDLKALLLVLQGSRDEGFALLQESENLARDVFPAGGPHTDGHSLHVLRAVDALSQEPNSKKTPEQKTIYWANAHGLQLFLKLVEGLYLIRQGVAAGAAALVEQLENAAPDHRPNYVSGIADLLAGLLAERNGQPEAAKDSLARALHAFEALRTPLERAVARAAWANAMQPEQEPAARLAWQQSLDEFKRLGANACVDWMSRILSARTEAGTLDVLSSREREIAEHVVLGLTNKEIAETLQLSPRTVSTHLEKIYRKLDVNSRTALARKWNQS